MRLAEEFGIPFLETRFFPSPLSVLLLIDLFSARANKNNFELFELCAFLRGAFLVPVKDEDAIGEKGDKKDKCQTM
jgi:hypothetical protein